MRLVKASLEPPAGLLDLIREIGDGENGFVGEEDLIRGKIDLQAYLLHLVDMTAGRNLRDGWVPMTTFWLLDEGRGCRWRKPPAARPDALPAEPRRSHRLLRSAGAARQRLRQRDFGANSKRGRSSWHR